MIRDYIKKKEFSVWVIITTIIVLTVFSGLWKLIRHWYPIPLTAAEFGDSFGAANALFSALAFAFLIVTVVMQKKELQLQRKELKKTNKAHNENLKLIKSQNRISQTNEEIRLINYLFQQFKEEISSASYSEDEKVYNGVYAIQMYTKEYLDLITKQLIHTLNPLKKYKVLHAKWIYILDQYISLCYSIKSTTSTSPTIDFTIYSIINYYEFNLKTYSDNMKIIYEALPSGLTTKSRESDYEYIPDFGRLIFKISEIEGLLKEIESKIDNSYLIERLMIDRKSYS